MSTLAAGSAPRATERLRSGCTRTAFATTDPNLVRKIGHRGNNTENYQEAQIYHEIKNRENYLFRVAPCWLAPNGDLIMQRIYGRHIPFCDYCYGCGEACLDGDKECTVADAHSLWGDIVTDIHYENLIMDDEGTTWLVDYAC